MAQPLQQTKHFPAGPESFCSLGATLPELHLPKLALLLLQRSLLMQQRDFRAPLLPPSDSQHAHVSVCKCIAQPVQSLSFVRVAGAINKGR